MQAVVSAIFNSLSSQTLSKHTFSGALHQAILAFVSHLLEHESAAFDILQRDGIWTKLFGPKMFWLSSDLQTSFSSSPSAPPPLPSWPSSKGLEHAEGSTSSVCVRIDVVAGDTAVKLTLKGVDTDSGKPGVEAESYPLSVFQILGEQSLSYSLEKYSHSSWCDRSLLPHKLVFGAGFFWPC